jgi:hypothetical protein
VAKKSNFSYPKLALAELGI